MIDNQPVDSHVHRFEEEALTPDDDVRAVADKFLQYFQRSTRRRRRLPRRRLPGGGQGERALRAGRAHDARDEIRRVNATDDGDVQYGVVRAGDVLVANRLIDKNYLPLFAAMPLQDAIDYAVHLIRTTIDTLRFEPRYPSVGGPIDVLVVKPDGMQWVQRKELRGRGVG